MSKYWEFIAQCLRAELADYGGLLHLFEAQQRSLFGRDSDSVLRFANEIEAQARLISQSRTRREEALIAEVNTLLHRVRRASRHNHTLLARAVEVHQETLQHLRPAAFTKTYSPAGRLAVSTAHPPVKLRAAG